MSGTKAVGLTIDGRTLRVEADTTVLAAADGAGIAIPRFCFHPAFEPEGNCRMCLVEIEGLPKLELACSTVAREGMVVRTNTPAVAAARRDVLEFLLADHPLDCPICDKAGECFLQDYYEAYGRFGGRFAETKDRKAKTVPLSPNLLLDRERCILCTRCVRFLRRVTGTGELGLFERGLRSEIGLYEGAEITSGYAGNLVDLCPVGAITDRDFRFKTRAWFLDRAESVCPACGRGCAIVIQSVKGYPLAAGARKIFRVQAGSAAGVNGFWICDVGRYGYHAIEENRQGSIEGVADADKGIFSSPASSGRDDAWQSAIHEIARRVRALRGAGRSSRIALVTNSTMTNEELALCRATFRDICEAGNVYLVDPPPGHADGCLMTAERTPNLRGALDLGFSPHLPDLDELGRSTDLLVVFGRGLEDRFAPGDLARAFERIDFRVLVTPHKSALNPYVHVVLPAALTAEKSGTFTNCDGVSRRFRAALTAPRSALAEGEILRRLAAGLERSEAGS